MVRLVVVLASVAILGGGCGRRPVARDEASSPCDPQTVVYRSGNVVLTEAELRTLIDHAGSGEGGHDDARTWVDAQVGTHHSPSQWKKRLRASLRVQGATVP